jgi:putative flippase GtrA
MTTAGLHRSLWRFAAVGVANTGAGLLFIYAARALGLGEISANAIGYALGLVLSFALNRQWTFGHQGRLLPSAAKFVLVVFVAWIANVAVVLELMRWGAEPVFAQAGGVLPYAFVNFVGCRWWAFARRIATMEGGLT